MTRLIQQRQRRKRVRGRTDQAPLPPRQAWSRVGPHAIGTERFATVSNGASFAQVVAAILRKRGLAQNPDKDEVPRM